jgi:carboxyl-terminal processing protease
LFHDVAALIGHNEYTRPSSRAGKSNRYNRILVRRKSSWQSVTWLFAGLFAASVAPSRAQISPALKQLQLDSFETVWSTIRDKHWDPKPGGLDWQAVHDEFLPRMQAAKSVDESREIMRAMLGRLKQTHFAIIPSLIYQASGDGDVALGDGTPGFDVRLLPNGAGDVSKRPAVIVVESDSSSQVKQGWEVLSAAGTDLRTLVEKLREDHSLTDLTLHRAITSRLTGPPGATREFEFLDGENHPVKLNIRLAEPRGNLAGFGNLPAQRVWFESKKIGNTGYIRFNEFLDLVRMMGQFGKAVQECAKCDGIVIDLRGNPGGIGAMAMGMAGFLVDKPDLKLGTMYMRGAKLNFVINPRAEAYAGPVAVLVDELSASTAEIFAGGLKDIGRARIFGTRTTGAALPSVFTRLPNGDGFQYAVANYISEGGKALEANGVTPDVEVRLTREGLLTGNDAVLEEALKWISNSKQDRQGK